MSTVLHPAGPEPAQTYWMRRLAVIGVAIVVLAVAVALIANGTSSGSAVQDESPPPLAAPATAAATPTPTPTPSAIATARSSASPSPSGGRTSPTASTTASATPTGKPKPTPKPKPAACPPGSLRPTLTGPQRLKPKQRTIFGLSLINGSGRTCAATLNRDTFELVINSGSDRIWSTEDCATIVTSVTKTLQAEEALEWKLTWNGLRSRSGCRSRPEIPRPGTYWATAQLTGAEPVRLRMTLRG